MWVSPFQIRPQPLKVRCAVVAEWDEKIDSLAHPYPRDLGILRSFRCVDSRYVKGFRKFLFRIACRYALTDLCRGFVYLAQDLVVQL